MCFWASSSVTQPAWAQTWICEDVIMILRLEKKKKKTVPAGWQVSKISTYLLCVSSSVKSGSYQVLSAQCLQEPFTSKSTWRLTTKGPWSRDERRKSSDRSDSWRNLPYTHAHCTETLACTLGLLVRLSSVHVNLLFHLHVSVRVCVCVVSELLTLWVSFSCPLRRGSSSS